MPDLPGTYQAVLPCNQGCAGIAISVELRSDQTAVVKERRMGGNLDTPIEPSYVGPYRFEPAGSNLLVLSPSAQQAAVYQFFVSPQGWIEKLDAATSAPLSPRSMYRLRKTSLPSQ